ncbi:unnamed protein product [Parnassius apollo]|uniref:(apollo) hypothetical protein n=1 Tax=Parnassius apollo TaxID=110799 RepID=A0A8S3X8Y7_PARAO|nr:unnamed protein product [Parnassius apollo]
MTVRAFMMCKAGSHEGGGRWPQCALRDTTPRSPPQPRLYRPPPEVSHIMLLMLLLLSFMPCGFWARVLSNAALAAAAPRLYRSYRQR